MALEADISLVSAEGRTRSVLLGLGCLVDDSHGYVLFIQTDTSGGEIARVEEDGSFSTLAFQQTSENLRSGRPIGGR